MIHKLPWKVKRPDDPLDEYLTIQDANGYDVCTFYGTFADSVEAIRLILEKVNPPVEVNSVQPENSLSGEVPEAPEI